MTLLETERLVRKISDVLRQIGNTAMAPKLAEDFAAACHSANLRLQQCESMLKARDSLQALQLAETAPNLLDLVTLLEFLGCDEWRNYCQRSGLAVAERIDARAVRTLNDCYGAGITTDHPLYAIYRRAVLSRDDEGALRVLQTIAPLNPGDSNAASELARLDAKVLGIRLDGIDKLLQAGDAARLLAEVDAIEAFGFKNKPGGDAWRKTQVIRCAHLLKQAEESKAANDWMETLAKLEFIERLRNEFALQLPADAAPKLEALTSWARAEQEKDNQNRAFQALLGDLQQRIDASEQKDTSARYVELPELRDDFEGLHKTWRSLVDFTRAIPEEFASRFRKRSALLEGEIARRTALRRRMIFAAAAATVLLCASVGWWVIRQGRILEFTSQIHSAIAQRQTRAAESLLERLRGRDQSLLGAGRVTAAAGEAEALLNKERALLAGFKGNFAKLPEHLDGAAEPDSARLGQITGQLASTKRSLDALAPDLKAENEPRMQAFDRQWQAFLTDAAETVDQRLEPWVGDAEQRCQTLDYRAPVAATTAQMAAISSVLGRIEDCEAAFTNFVQVRGDLLERAAASRAKLAAYQRELKKLEDGMAMVKKARGLKEFSEGLERINSSEFAGSPEALAAAAMLSVNPNDQTALRALLGISNPATWAFLGKPPAGFVPKAAMPAERDMLKELSQDPCIGQQHWHYRFWLDPQGKQTEEWVTAGPLDTSTGWHHIQAWDPAIFPSAAMFQEREYGYFEGQLRLSPTQIVYHREDLGNLADRGSFASLGLDKILSSGSGYAKPLLEILDLLKEPQTGSPLFRGYLFLRLTDMMNLQPDAWGVTFCPSLTADANRLRDIGGRGLLSGDWFVPAKEKLYGPPLERFFASIEPISYAKQAEGLAALDRASARDGLQYVGIIDINGAPSLAQKPASGPLWAYSADSRPAKLERVDEPSASGSGPRIMALSPVFALPEPPRQYLAEAGVVPNDPSFKGVLPPLFESSTQRQP